MNIFGDNLKQKIEAAMTNAIADGALPEAALPAFIIERPADKKNGDFSTNAAMAPRITGCNTAAAFSSARMSRKMLFMS